MSDGELLQTMKRLMSIHDEIDERKVDLKEVYADAKSAGFDKTALGLAIREIRGRARAEKPDAQERAAIVDLYVAAFDNAPRTYVHVPAREEAAESTYPERISRPAATPPSVKPPEAQSEAPASASLEHGADALAVEVGVSLIAAQSAPFVTLTGAGEGLAGPADPAPAVDARPVSASPAFRPRPTNAELDIPAFLRRTRESAQPAGDHA